MIPKGILLTTLTCTVLSVALFIAKIGGWLVCSWYFVACPLFLPGLAMVLWMLCMLILTFGFMWMAAEGVQGAREVSVPAEIFKRSAGYELAHHPRFPKVR